MFKTENMKTHNQAKSGQTATSSSDQRSAIGLRPGAAKTLEHRYVRRKIREQLRRLDWALAGEDDVLA
jgi:hypothetical protein